MTVMLEFRYLPTFKKDIKRIAHQGRDIMKLFSPLLLLLNAQTLPPQYKDHSLRGNWSGHREFHVEPDWLVIYRMENETVLILVRTGTHTELFD